MAAEMIPTWGRNWSYVELGHNYKVGKIDAYVEVFTTWRGELVRAEFHFNRYSTSSGLSEWRGYVHTAGRVDSIEKHYSSDLVTDTARARIGQAFYDAALKIVENDDAARVSAILYAMRDELRKSYDPANDYNRFSSAHIDDAAISGDVLDVLRNYANALTAANDAGDLVTKYARSITGRD